MGFPLSIECVTPLPRVRAITPEVVRQLEGALVEQGASVIDRSEDTVAFRVPFERVSLWFFERGLVTVRGTADGVLLRFEASCRRSAFAIAMGSLFVGLVALKESPRVGATVAIVAWLWMFGGHYFVESRRCRTRFVHVSGRSPSPGELPLGSDGR
jgi:hypothetical protein